MKTQYTKATKIKEVQRSWHLVDLKGKVLGYAGTEIAKILIGKDKSNYVSNLDCGDNVVVINSKHVEVTGKKEKEKTYGQYSGYPGGLKVKALWQIRKEKPNEIIRHAVWGMLPKNKLRARLITRLYIFSEADHPYKDKFTK